MEYKEKQDLIKELEAFYPKNIIVDNITYSFSAYGLLGGGFSIGYNNHTWDYNDVKRQKLISSMATEDDQIEEALLSFKSQFATLEYKSLNLENWEKEQRNRIQVEEINSQDINFEKKLEMLINMNSKEKDSNTPDFILAQYIVNCLNALNRTIIQREKWYGRTTNNSEDKEVNHEIQ